MWNQGWPTAAQAVCGGLGFPLRPSNSRNHALGLPHVPPQRTCPKAKGILRQPDASGCLVPWTDTLVLNMFSCLQQLITFLPSPFPSSAYLLIQFSPFMFPLSLLSVLVLPLIFPNGSSFCLPLCLSPTISLSHTCGNVGTTISWSRKSPGGELGCPQSHQFSPTQLKPTSPGGHPFMCSGHAMGRRSRH